MEDKKKSVINIKAGKVYYVKNSNNAYENFDFKMEDMQRVIRLLFVHNDYNFINIVKELIENKQYDLLILCAMKGLNTFCNSDKIERTEQITKEIFTNTTKLTNDEKILRKFGN